MPTLANLLLKLTKNQSPLMVGTLTHLEVSKEALKVMDASKTDDQSSVDAKSRYGNSLKDDNRC